MHICEDDWKTLYVNEIVPKDYIYTDDDGLTWKGFCGSDSNVPPEIKIVSGARALAATLLASIAVLLIASS